MTIKQFKLLFYLVIGTCILTVILAFNSFEFIEINTASGWTIRYFTWPIFIVMALASCFIYLKLLRQYEGKHYRSKLLTNMRSVFRIIVLSLALTGIFYATTLSVIILSNATGNIQTVHLQATVVDYYTTKNKGRLNHYIKIKDKSLNRIVELKVDRPFQIGQQFNKTMNIGRWGLLYY